MEWNAGIKRKTREQKRGEEDDPYGFNIYLILIDSVWPRLTVTHSTSLEKRTIYPANDISDCK